MKLAIKTWDNKSSDKVELHQSVDGLRRRVHNIDQPFMRAHFIVFLRTLVNVR